MLHPPGTPGEDFGREITGLKHGHSPQLFLVAWIPAVPGGQSFRVKISTLTLHEVEVPLDGVSRVMIIVAGRRSSRLPSSCIICAGLFLGLVGGSGKSRRPCRGREVRPLLTSSAVCGNAARLGRVLFRICACRCRKSVIQEL